MHVTISVCFEINHHNNIRFLKLMNSLYCLVTNYYSLQTKI
jgi:hypothetical protein